MKIFVFLLLFLATNLTLAADNDTPEMHDQAVKTWNRRLDSGENLTAQQLREAILCFGFKMSDVYQELGTDLSDADEIKYILPLEKSQFNASKKLLSFPRDQVQPNDITFHWTLCNNLGDYSRAYQTALSIMEDPGFSLDKLTEDQLSNLVETYSHYEPAPTQKIEELATFLKSKGQPESSLTAASLVKLMDLYINRCMHQEIVAFCTPILMELLGIDDPEFGERFQYTIPSFLICKQYDRAQSIVHTSSASNKSMFQALIHVAMGKREAAEQSLEAYKNFITENPKGIDPEEIRVMPFLVKLLKKDIPGAVTVLESIPSRSKYFSSLLIFLMEKGKYPESQIQSLKSQYESAFLKPYNPYFLRHFQPVIAILLGDNN